MYVGIDIGGTKIATAVVDTATGSVMSDVHSIATRAELGGAEVLQRIIGLAQHEVAQARQAGFDIAGIGVGSAGVVDPETGSILAATDIMPGWVGQPLGAALVQATRLPVQVTNDVMAHGIGEAVWGAGAGHQRVLACAVGTGIGGAIIVDGMPVEGAHHVAGHIGHVCHRLAYGMHCSCGSDSGHLEAIASGSGIHAWYEQRRLACAAQTNAGSDVSEQAEQKLAFPPAANGGQVAQFASEGNTLASQIIHDAGIALGESLAGICHVVDPDIVVISGSVTHAGEPWWQAVQQGFASSSMPSISATRVVPGSLDSTAPLLGAAYVIESYLHRRNSQVEEQRR